MPNKNPYTKHLNYRNRIKRVMEEEGRPMTTGEIMAALKCQPQITLPNRFYKNNPTKSELANILYSYSTFERCNHNTVSTSLQSKNYAYEVALWQLVQEEE